MKVNLGLYMNAKPGYTGTDALESYAVRNLEQLLRLRDSADLQNLNIEVRFARFTDEYKRPIRGGFDTKLETHWKGAREFNPKSIVGNQIMAPVGHQVTGHRARLLTAESLTSFVKKMRANDEDAGNVLVLWGHGDGPRGFLFSLFAAGEGQWNRDILSPQEVETALAISGDDLHKLNLVCLESCQGACLEFASILAPHAEYFIASQTPLPGSGWNYGQWPKRLINDDPGGWEGIAKAIASDFAVHKPFDTSISVIRLDGIEAVLDGLQAVTADFLNDPKAAEVLLDARRNIPTYDHDVRGLVDFSMLFSEADRRLTNVGITDLARKCRELATTMEAAISASHVSNDLKTRCPMAGCSIFFPTEKSAFGKPWDEITDSIYFGNPKQLTRFKQTRWQELVKKLSPVVVNRPPLA